MLNIVVVYLSILKISFRLCTLILDKEKANGKQIINEKYIHDMFIPNNKLIDSEILQIIIIFMVFMHRL